LSTFLGPLHDALEAFLKRWPKAFPLAVEPRHPCWFDQGRSEALLDDLLASRGAERVVFDARPLFAREADTDAEREARQRKPNLPERRTALGREPFVRLVGRDDIAACGDWFEEWADVIGKWIAEGRAPCVYVHAPDDANAPFLARRLHERLQRRVPRLPDLPAFGSPTPAPAIQGKQLNLFPSETGA